MFKNQLQELAQRSCFNLPAYAWMREGPDHAPRFKASVNFNGETFESPSYSPTLRQAEHAAAEVALNVLSCRGSKSLTARVLDETGVYKNLLQETAHKAGLNLPVYTTLRSGPGHVPVFTCTVELAGMSFTGESAKTKKQAEKNAAIAAWSALKKMPSLVTRVLSNLRTQKSEKQKDHNYHHHQQHPHKHPRRNTRPWRSVNPIKYNKPWKQPSEIPVISANSSSQKQHNSFVDFLPPPAPRTTSKILPLTSRSNCVLEEKGRDGKMDVPVSNKPAYVLEEQCLDHLRSLFLTPLSCAHMGLMGNYSNNFKGIAPAVQIRSIIPVCAAPSPTTSSTSVVTKCLPLNPPKLQKEPTSSLPTNLISELVPTLAKPNSSSNQLDPKSSKLEPRELIEITS